LQSYKEKARARVLADEMNAFLQWKPTTRLSLQH
jgi:hypothetical protein